MPFLKSPDSITGIVLRSGRQLDVEHGMVTAEDGDVPNLIEAGFRLLNDDEAQAILDAAAPPAPPAPPADDKKPGKK